MTPLLAGVYSPEVENRMRNLFNSMNEKDRRRYAAAEADKLGYAGIAYVAWVVDCDPDTIRHGPDGFQLGREARPRHREPACRL
jgi:hypothetical protein